MQIAAKILTDVWFMLASRSKPRIPLQINEMGSVGGGQVHIVILCVSIFSNLIMILTRSSINTRYKQRRTTTTSITIWQIYVESFCETSQYQFPVKHSFFLNSQF